MRRAEGRFEAAGGRHRYVSVAAALGAVRYAQMPYVARVLAENLLRHMGRPGVTTDVVAALADPDQKPDTVALPLHVPRLIVPDSSGIPVLMDLAALRDCVARAGGDAAVVDSAVPIAFIVDHSLQVDVAGSSDAVQRNLAREFERNGERYRFVKWAERAFAGVSVFPPGSGIIHQVHLEQIASVALRDGEGCIHPDFALGGDSHTPMVNALGVLGWGVGGIELETVALGEPYILPKPAFVGVRLEGSVRGGVTTTDIALALTERLRKAGVVGACVEFFGPAVVDWAVPDRATLANMAPEYGATTGFWPVDRRTIEYLVQTGREPAHVALVEGHARASGLWREGEEAVPHYDRVIEVDVSAIGRSIAGPAKPHNRQSPETMAQSFIARHGEPAAAGCSMPAGAVAIAAITSCTNTANPHGMMRAGLIARNAVARGLEVKPWVKTSLAPGSRAVTEYLRRASLMEPLEALGFHVIGYGCTTCGGKSGPLKPEAVEGHTKHGLPLAAVLSGNRNFDGRIHRLVAASYLAAPALVVAYALAGRVTGNIETDVLGQDRQGRDVRLADLWPAEAEVQQLVGMHVTPEVFAAARVADGQAVALWRAINAPEGLRFGWDAQSEYIVEPPFFEVTPPAFSRDDRVGGVRVLGIYDDGLTTDHVSPGGEIPADSPAGQYLIARGVEPAQFNSYVGRRGNHNVLARGTYSNVKISNRMAGRDGWWTRHEPSGDVVSVFEASERYRANATPLVVLAGHDFGSGSSRDWAAKGPLLLGVGAVVARSFERIHRSNLIGVGIVPLLFAEGDSVESLGLDGSEVLEFDGLDAGRTGASPIRVRATGRDGRIVAFDVAADVRSAAEAALIETGGVFAAALAKVSGHG